jgi:hypothetical protein
MLTDADDDGGKVMTTPAMDLWFRRAEDETSPTSIHDHN